MKDTRPLPRRLIDRLPFATRKELRESPRFVIDNVADYFFQSEKYRGEFAPGSWDYQDFPHLAPPFHRCWMEYRVPFLPDGYVGLIVLEQRPPLWREKFATLAPDEQAAFHQVAEQVLTAAVGERSVPLGPEPHAFSVYTQLYFQAYLERRTGQRGPSQDGAAALAWALATRMRPDLAWIVVYHPILFLDGTVRASPTLFFLGLDGQGAILPDAHCGRYAWTVAQAVDSQHWEAVLTTPGLASQEGEGKLMNWLFPVLLATSFLHCHNVSTAERVPNKRLSARHHHRHQLPLFTYKTLQIEPMQRVLRHEGQAESGGLKRALSICRGHFADYSEGRGLFGKHRGVYWIPQHVTGSAEAGTVHKDYAVAAPCQQPADGTGLRHATPEAAKDES
jgi:hypothetical protein